MRLISCLALATLFASGPVAAQSLDGKWSGGAVSQGSLLLFDLEFETIGDSLHTILTLPYNGFTRFPYPFQYRDGRLKSELFGDEMDLLVDLEEGQLRGTVVEDDSVSATVFLQRVLSFPLPGYREEEVRFSAGTDTLAGSIPLPEGPGPYPAIVYVTGRSYGNRCQTYDMANRLVKFGIAGLVFDSRGTGRSTGRREATIGEGRSEDVSGAIEVLSKRDDIRRDQIGLLGNSAGGWVAPVVARRSPHVAFIVTIVGPAESLADQQGHVIQGLMRRSGVEFTAEGYRAAPRVRSDAGGVAA